MMPEDIEYELACKYGTKARLIQLDIHRVLVMRQDAATTAGEVKTELVRIMGMAKDLADALGADPLFGGD